MKDSLNGKNAAPLNLLLDKVIYISRKINSFHSLPELLDAIMATAAEILESEAASVLLLDEKKENLVFFSVVGDKKELLKQFTIPSDKGLAGYTIKHREAVIVNDTRGDKRFYDQVDQRSGFKTRNLMSFPLVVKEETIGVLEVINSKDPKGFEDRDLRILSYISELSALAIYNRVLYDKSLKTNRITNKRVEELNALYTLLNTYSLSIDEINLRDIFKEAVHIIQKTLHCARVSIFLKVSKGNNFFELISRVGFLNQELKEGQIISIDAAVIMQKVSQLKEPVFIMNDHQANLTLEDLYVHLPREGKYRTPNFLSFPIMNDDEIVGFVNATEKEEELGTEGFDEFDFSLMRSVAMTLGNIYQQHLTYKESIHQKIVNKELETAASIQRRMLTQNFPAFDSMDIYGFNIPARNVSGDFYGVQKVSSDQLAVYIGDVSGKGLPAAFFMATASTSLKEKVSFYSQPSVVLSKLNNTLFEEMHEGMFVTLAYFLVNKTKKNLTFSFAGHNDQFLYRAQENKVLNIRTPGKPLGIMFEIEFFDQEISYESGDVLLLCTDGVTEALMEKREEDGEKLLMEVLKSAHSMSAKDITALVKNVFLEDEKEELFDDFTILVIKF